MQVYQVRRPAICCSCTVRPSAIRSLELPHRVFPQNSSSSAHTSSHTKASHQVQELTLLSINLVCGIHEEKGDELFEHAAAIVCTLCRLKEAWSALSCDMTAIPLGTNLSEWLNIQKRDWPLLGPSFTNSWPRPFPHFPHRTWRCTSQYCEMWKLTQGYNQWFDLFSSVSPCMFQAFLYVWTHCRHGWSLWKLATERSVHTWSGWRRAHDHIWSRHKYLRKKTWEKNRTLSAPKHEFRCFGLCFWKHCPLLRSNRIAVWRHELQKVVFVCFINKLKLRGNFYFFSRNIAQGQKLKIELSVKLFT